MYQNRSILTFAVNKRHYVKLAFNLADSILLFNDLPVYIVSNLKITIPKHLQKRVIILEAKKEHANLGIEIKLYIDHYLQTEETLFIDSDCLCYSDLEPIFTACKDQDVSVVGNIVNSDFFCGTEQAKVIYDQFKIKHLPKFNGGVFFLKKNRITTSIYNFARSIVPNYDRFGFQRNKTSINEEGLIAIAMTVFTQKPIPDNGRFMTDLYTDPRPKLINVVLGTRKLNNPNINHPNHRPWYPTGTYSPILLHFGGSSIHSFPYNKQAFLLYLNKVGLPRLLAIFLANSVLEIPYRGYYLLKRLFSKVFKSRNLLASPKKILTDPLKTAYTDANPFK